VSTPLCLNCVNYMVLYKSGTTRETRCRLNGSQSGTFMNVFPTTEIIRPVGDASPNEHSLSTGTDAYALVDEETANDDTDYIYNDADATWKTDKFTMGDLTGTYSKIKRIEIVVRAKKVGNAGVYLSDFVELGVDIDGIYYPFGSATPQDSYMEVRESSYYNPSTRKEWESSDINDLIGVVKTKSVASTGDIRVTQFFIRVFTEANCDSYAKPKVQNDGDVYPSRKNEEKSVNTLSSDYDGRLRTHLSQREQLRDQPTYRRKRWFNKRRGW